MLSDDFQDFGFPQEYKKLVSKIRDGEYGEDLKEFFENHPGAVVDAERELYQCPACNHLAEEHKMTLYCHKDEKAPEYGYWLQYDEDKNEYVFIKNLPHKCPQCGKRMHILDNVFEPLPCPKCGGKLIIADLIRWD